MKKPTLRFRQVYEHPTHFKVTKPLGNPMIIAKQGLSDAMQNRLRKYAMAGEVTEPAPSEQDLSVDSRALDVSPAIEAPKAPLMGAPTLAEIMSRPEFVGEEDRSETPVEVIKASDIAQAPVEALPVVAPEQALATPIVTVPQKIQAGALMGPPAPVEPVMKAAAPSEQEDPLVWMNKLIEEEKTKDKPNQEALKAYESTRDQYIKQMQEEQASSERPAVVAAAAPIKQDDTVARFNKLIDSEQAKENPDEEKIKNWKSSRDQYIERARAEQAAAKPPAVVAPVTAPVVASALAPAAAVVEAQPAKEIVIPKDFDAAKPLTIESYRAAREANKGFNDKEIALALINKIAPGAVIPPNFDALLQKPPEGASKDDIAEFDSAKAELAKSIVNQAKVDFETTRNLIEANKNAQAQKLINADKDRVDADAIVKRRDALRMAVEGGFQPQSYFGTGIEGLGRQIGTALSVAMGAFASGMTGMPNYAFKIYEDAVNRDLEVQKGRYNSLVNQYTRILGDADDAEKLARADLNDLAALQVEGVKAQSNLKSIGPAADGMIAKMRADANKERAEVLLKQSAARRAKVDADLEEQRLQSIIDKNKADAEKKRALGALGAAGRGAAAKPTVGAEAGEYETFQAITDPNKKKEYFAHATNPQTGKSVTFIVAPKLQKATQEEISRRESGLEKANELIKVIESNPKVFEGKDLGRVSAAMADFLGNVPEASGKGRMLSVADKDIYLKAIQETNIPFIKSANLFGKTLAAAKQFKRSTEQGIRTAIEGRGIEGHPGKAELVSAYQQVLGGGPQMVRIRLKTGEEKMIPAQNLEAAKQRLGKMFDTVIE